MLVAACAAVPVQKRLLPLLARPASASACPPGATFVSLVSNESYVPGALCLVRAMRKLGGTCPFLLLLDDLPAPPGAHAELALPHLACAAWIWHVLAATMPWLDSPTAMEETSWP